MLRCGIEECETISMTTPSTGNALPQSVATAVQQYNSVDRTPIAVVCSGTIVKTADTYGILFQDSPLSTSATYITRAPRVLMQIVQADASSITNGVDLYIVDATMRVTHTASSNVWIGKAIGPCETDPVGLPAGIYVPVNFKQANV
jgi:hypothetical protein